MVTLKKFLLLFLVGIIPLISRAQTYGHYFSLTGGIGDLIAQHENLEVLRGTYSVVDLRWGVHANGDAYWEQAHHNPIYGIGASFGGVNNTYLGKLAALYTFMDFPIAKSGPLSLRTDFAAGITYFNNPYDPLTNPLNAAVSSHILAKLSVGGQAAWQLDKQWAVNLWAGLDHYSNGSWTKPNAGINTVLVKAGVSYNLQDQVHYVDKLDPPTMPLMSIVTYGAFSTFQIGPTDERYNAGTGQITFNYRLSYKSKIGIGFDCTYNNAIDPYHQSTKKSDLLQGGIVLSHEMAMNRVSLLTQLVFLQIHDNNKPVYERIALRYWVNDSLFASAGLRTRMGYSEFVELGLGYSFNWGSTQRINKKRKA